MSQEVEHIELPTASLFVGKTAMVTTRNEVYNGPKPVVEKLKQTGKVALWGPNNDFPTRVVNDLEKTSVAAAVIETKVDMLVGNGGLCYGLEVIDPANGLRKLIPKRDPEVEAFLKDINQHAVLTEAATDWYTFYNVFPEFRMGRAYDRVVGLGIQDAVDVRLETMDENAEYRNCYIADWGNGATEADGFMLPLLENYGNPAKQLLQERKPRSVLPVRYLNHGRRYYGRAPWNSLRANGTIDIANRIMELKKLLINQISHIRYHIEADERYWERVIPDFVSMKKADQIAAMRKHVQQIEEWLTKDGQGGTFMSGMLAHGGAKDQTSLLRINEKRMTTPDGAYIEDTQETHFIICRDMGLKPSLLGISPSKSGSSPGSGSEDRVARNNHLLKCGKDQNAILRMFDVVRDVNGWNPEYKFWFENYYVATLDRSNVVSGVNPDKKTPEA